MWRYYTPLYIQNSRQLGTFFLFLEVTLFTSLETWQINRRCRAVTIADFDFGRRVQAKRAYIL
jgi:hypothetical protein